MFASTKNKKQKTKNKKQKTKNKKTIKEKKVDLFSPILFDRNLLMATAEEIREIKIIKLKMTPTLCKALTLCLTAGGADGRS